LRWFRKIQITERTSVRTVCCIIENISFAEELPHIKSQRYTSIRRTDITFRSDFPRRRRRVYDCTQRESYHTLLLNRDTRCQATRNMLLSVLVAKVDWPHNVISLCGNWLVRSLERTASRIPNTSGLYLAQNPRMIEL
jgi:hypothetical protein